MDESFAEGLTNHCIPEYNRDMNIQDATLIAEHARKHNGGTYRVDKTQVMSVNPLTGYLVSLNAGKVTRYLRARDIQRFLNKHMDAFLPDVFFGLWYSDQAWYLDITVHFHEKESALHLANLEQQKAIWDCKNQTEIYL